MLQSTGIPDTDFVLREHMEEINRLFEGETVEEIIQNLEKEASPWSLKQLDTLKKMVCENALFLGFLINTAQITIICTKCTCE